MATISPELKAIFWEALDCPSVEERRAYLDRACRGDSALRSRIDALLIAHRDAGDFLEEPVPTPTVTWGLPAPTEAPGTVIGPYKLLEVIGEGGMGIVYMAEQTRPVRRKVALKLIKPGMDSKPVIARFEAERQALAMMEHPSIARVYDAGSTEGGQPYFVMELVRGTPITEYCDRARLSIGERLELFLPVCQAVQHAHQKGIIHRDLKPSNVLVGLYDGRPVPKVIDFGVAKATGPKLTEATLYTGFGTIIGTPEYMSPEQALLDNLDIDTRSDVYALGILLYELLTGTTPLDRRRLGKAALMEVLRVVREEEPPKPSTRLSTTEEAPAIAANRNVGPHRLTGLVRGELDWIVMKALEKDRNRRYESANGLAADLRRYLDGEPVQACPPSPGYRLRKVLHRHRGSVLTAASLAGLMIVGTVVSAWEAVRATRAEGKTLAALGQAKDRRDLALRAVEDMWVGFAEKWLADEPALEQTQREFVQKALAFYERLTREEGDDPELQREVGLAYHRLGAIHDRLGDLGRSTAAYARAADVFGRLAREDPGGAEYRYWQARSLAEHGEVCDRLGQGPEAEGLARRALGLFEKAASDFPDNLRIQAGLADCCLVVATVNLLPGPRLNAIYITDAVPEPRWTESLRLLPRALSLYPKVVAGEPGKSDHRWRFHRAQKVLAQMPNVSWAERQRLTREGIAGLEALIREFPREHRPRTELCEALGFRATLLSRAGQAEETEAAYRQALAMADGLVADYPKVPYYIKLQASARRGLGNLLTFTDRTAEAEALLVQAATSLETMPDGLVPPWEPRYEAAACRKTLGDLWARAGRFDDAHRALREALALDLRVARESPNSATWSALNGDCARLLWVGLRAGHVDDAIRAYREVAATWKQLAEARPTDPVVGQLAALAFNITGFGLMRLDRLDEADRAYSEGQAILARWEQDTPFAWTLGNTYFVSRDWQGWAFIQENRADLRLLAGHPEEAAGAHRRRVDWCRRRLEADRTGAAANRRAVAAALRELAAYLDRLGRPPESVAQAYRESIAAFDEIARDATAGPESRGEGAGTRMELASVLQRAGRADEANALADEALDIRRAIAQSSKPNDRGGLAETLADHALIRARTGRSGEGLADLDEAAALSGPLADVGATGAEALAALARLQDRRGRLLEHEGRLPESAGAYAEAVALGERLAREVSDDSWTNLDRRAAHARSLATLGRFHLRHGQAELAGRRFAEARTAYEQAAASFSTLDTAQSSLARFLATCPVASLRDPSRAIRVAEKGVALNADLGGAETGALGVAQVRVGDDRAALASLDRAIRLNGGHPHAEQLFFRAQARRRLGETDGARRDYDEAVRLMAFSDEDWSELGQFRQEAAAVLGIEDDRSADPLSRGKP